VAYELSAGDGPPPSGPVTAEAVRAALADGGGFTVADDPGGWLVLTATVGPPRWVQGPTPGSVVGEKQRARLTRLPGAEGAAIRPEALALISTDINLTVNLCLAISSALGPLRARIRGCDEWIAVDASGSALFVHLGQQWQRMSKGGS
jgi:hypothetical protein